MYLFTSFLLFILIWWIIFFISLPIRISVPKENIIKGNATSAPIKTYIGLKFAITTAISGIIMLFVIMMKFDLGRIFAQ